jgi:hypothetical protein
VTAENRAWHATAGADDDDHQCDDKVKVVRYEEAVSV